MTIGVYAQLSSAVACGKRRLYIKLLVEVTHMPDPDDLGAADFRHVVTIYQLIWRDIPEQMPLQECVTVGAPK
jgi:hypothetical protein